MPDVIGIDHIYITVSDLTRSAAFYDPVMEILGFRRGDFVLQGEEHIQYFNRHFSYVLRPAHSHHRYDTSATGLHHFCMRVDSEADVRQAAHMLEERGIEHSEPNYYPEYAPDYVAVFLSDPDGIQLEITNYRQERRDRHDNWQPVS